MSGEARRAGRWTMLLEPSSEFTLEYSIAGVVRASFERDRSGFCVLHPPECVELSCKLEACSAESVECASPETVSPHQIKVIDTEVLPHG